MAKLKLFSGMDFSGKSTAIKSIDAFMPGVFTVQKKFLTPVYNEIKRLSENNIWMPRNEWRPFLQKIVKEDINKYQNSGRPVLQDSLWIVKYLASIFEYNNDPVVKDEIEKIQNLLMQYPEMDSFYFTASTEERQLRYAKREASGERITRSDTVLLNTEEFERTEKYYKKILISRFPNTYVIDTTGSTPEKTMKEIMNSENFLRDL